MTRNITFDTNETLATWLEDQAALKREIASAAATQKEGNWMMAYAAGLAEAAVLVRQVGVEPPDGVVTTRVTGEGT